MKIITALLCLVMSVLSVTAFTQRNYSGRCGEHHYRFEGKLINRITQVNTEGEQLKVSTFYKLDIPGDYLWLWTVEENETTNRITRFTTSWARLSDLDTSALRVARNSKALHVRLKNAQQYFFQTVFTSDKKGPQYMVANAININFTNTNASNAFVDDFSLKLNERYLMALYNRRK